MTLPFLLAGFCFVLQIALFPDWLKIYVYDTKSFGRTRLLELNYLLLRLDFTVSPPFVLLTAGNRIHHHLAFSRPNLLFRRMTSLRIW